MVRQSFDLTAVIKHKDYDFLRSNPQLKDQLIFLTLSGSYAYGTALASSDIDIRGCAFNRKHDLLTLKTFKHYTDTKTDTTVYGFIHFIELLASSNPHMLELLGNEPADYLIFNDIAREIIAKKKLFLAKQAAVTYRGYIDRQLKSIKNNPKAAMHVIRLYLTAIDLFIKEDIINKRTAEHKLLMAIRNGCFLQADGNYHNDYFELVADYHKQFDRALAISKLPDTVDYPAIQDFILSVNERVVKGEY